MNKFLLGSVVILLGVVAYLVTQIQFKSQGAKVESAQTTQEEPTSTPEPTLTPTNTPTPKKVSGSTNQNNSGRAYKVAAYFVTHLDGSSKVKAKQTYGNENMSDTDLIRMVATRLENDPALLAQSEAEVQKLLMQSTQQNVQYSYPDVNDNSDCQLRLAKYSACMSEYNAEMSEYSACVAEKATNPYKFCYKPANLCGFKPACF